MCPPATAPPLDEDTWTYPGDPPVAVEPHATMDADGYRVSTLSLGTHAGTHVDAPSHTEAGDATVDELPIGSFVFDALLVGLGGDVGARQPITVDHLPPVPDAADCSSSIPGGRPTGAPIGTSTTRPSRERQPSGASNGTSRWGSTPRASTLAL